MRPLETYRRRSGSMERVSRRTDGNVCGDDETIYQQR